MFHDTGQPHRRPRRDAEAGTLILWPDEHEPRLMSLVPPVHVVLLDSATIYNTFFEAMVLEGWKDGLPTTPCSFQAPRKPRTSR